MPETAIVPTVGLIACGASHHPVPLVGVSVAAEIEGVCAQVAIAQRYVNREATPIEAVYVFPLDEGAAVCGFEVVVDGTLIAGSVKSRDEAFETYDEAIIRGDGGFLLDEERPDVFQASIGNLRPGGEVVVRIRYVAELAIDDGRVRFTIPTAVSPRYAPADDQKGVGRVDAETLNPPLAGSVPYGLDLSVRISMPGPITGVESPSHPIALTLNGQRATVTLGQSDVALDRDFVLSMAADRLHEPRAWVERDDDGTETVAVSFAPTFSGSTMPSDVIFVVDRSGSMEGRSIEEVRNALQLCLRSLHEGCRFNIVGFGSTSEALFPESRAYDQASLDVASRHVAGLRADLGGTELLPALTSVLGMRHHEGLPRQVVVLTDGEITNTDAVLALAATHASRSRIFTFGIGAGASHHLVRGLARAGRGMAEFIYPGERIETRVARLVRRLLSPALTDVAVDWVDGEVTQAPLQVPPVFAGRELLLYGLVTKARPRAVRLTASSPSGPIVSEVPLSEAPASTGRTVGTLAARARIRELEEGSDYLSERGSRQRNRKPTSAAREIIELAIRYTLMSRETSFVAVERREAPIHGDLQLRRVPIMLTSGWGGTQQGFAMGRSAGVASRDVVMADMSLADMSLDDRAAYCIPSPFEPDLRNDMQHRPQHAVAPPPVAPVPRPAHRPDGLETLIMLQSADGTWDLTADLAAVLGRDLDDLVAALEGATGSDATVRRAWATALAFAWLQINAAGVEDEWMALGRKARSWLDDVNATPPSGWTWIDDGRRFLITG
jgi:hypothetical protein